MSSADAADAVAEANERFYQAFEALDLDLMAAIWARRLDDVCIHPGWEILEGWPAIRDSWAAIFANTSYMRFEPSDVEVEVFGVCARLTCVENIFSVAGGHTIHSQVACTNLFLLIDGEWRIALHHGSPISSAHHVAPLESEEEVN